MTSRCTVVAADGVEHTVHHQVDHLHVWQTAATIRTLESTWCSCGRLFSSLAAGRVHLRHPELHSTLDAWR